MARAAARTTDDNDKPAEPVTETVTYMPGDGDPAHTTWCGHTFKANVPKEITGHAEGTTSEQLNHHLIESARNNPHFKVGSSPRRRASRELPTTAEGYRAYMVAWLQDGSIKRTEDLIARFVKDRDLQAACEVGADDYSFLGTLFMPKLHELAKGDEMTEGQVAQMWVNHGVNQLPW